MSFHVYGAITPHPPIVLKAVGASRSAVTQATIDSLRLLGDLLERFRPDTLVVMSPHAPAVADAFAVLGMRRLHGDLAEFGASGAQVTAPGDPELAGALFAQAQAEDLPMIDRVDMYADLDLDHGVIVPLSFMHRDPGWRLVVLSVGKLGYDTHRILGRAVSRAAESIGRRVAFIASGDLSHRLTPEAPAGFTREGADFDALVVGHVERNDIAGLAGLDPDLVGHAGECGMRSMVALGGFLEGKGARSHVLSYEGPWGVGYMSAIAAEPEVVEELPTPAIALTGVQRRG